MKVFVFGQGGREHTLAWKIEQSPLVEEVYVGPGNGGTSSVYRSLPLEVVSHEDLASFALEEGIDLVVIGPEDPLVRGMADSLRQKGLLVFGPSAEGAKLEGSKIFAKELMEEYGIPTAPFQVFSHPKKALAYLEKGEGPVVVKADGLAAGKGVRVARTREEAREAVETMMIERAFGEAGDRILIEEYLEGEEASILALTDGENLITLSPSKDHKRAKEGDRGANTGGMGAFSPTPIIHEEMQLEVEERILRPTLKALKERGIEYRGVLYVGLMCTEKGPSVLEYNCRFGDPETQVVLPRMEEDLLPYLLEVAEGRMKREKVTWSPQVALCVIMASGGYPHDYKRGYPIEGLDTLHEDLLVFHAGTVQKEGRLLTDGGRVLGVTALGDTMREAREKVYKGLSQIHFKDCEYRRDIGEGLSLREEL